MITTKQAAARLDISVRRIQALVASGQLEAQKIGRDWLIDPVSVNRRLTLQEAQCAWSLLGIPRRLWGTWWLSDVDEIGAFPCPSCGEQAYSPAGETKYSDLAACPACGWKDEGSKSVD